MSRLVLGRVRFAATLLLLHSAPLLAQTQAPAPAASPSPTPRAGVTAAEEVAVLTLDVVAVDGKNRPVFGLTQADFEVRVAGKIQTIDFFEPPREGAARAALAPKEGRPDSEERIAGTTTPLEAKGAAVRHVLVWVDLEQLPRRSILDTAAALQKAFDHAPAGRYGIATHFGGTSARVWDADSVDAILVEADRMSAEVVENADADSQFQFEKRKLSENELIRDLIAAENAADQQGTQAAIQAISAHLAAERRRMKRAIEDLHETIERFSALEGPRHFFYVSEGFERVPGFNFLALLQAEESARVRSGSSAGGFSAPPPAGRGRPGSGGFPAIPGAPGSSRDLGAGRFAFDSMPLTEADDLARWLAASGVIVHFIDPGSLGRGLPSAEDKYAFNSALRQDEARNLQETPLRYAADTGGLSRVLTNDIGAALTDLLDATTATYRVGVRLVGMDPKKTYTVRVSARKAGVNMLARSAFRPAGRNAQVPVAVTAGARRSSLAAAVDEKRPGAARLAKKPLPVTLEWKGRSTLTSKDPAKPFWKLEVKVPHEALTFRPEEDAMLASVQIVVEAVSLDGPLRDSIADDWFLSYTGPEYREARDTTAVRAVTLQLPPGRWELNVSVHDALGDAFGAGVLRVDAPR